MKEIALIRNGITSIYEVEDDFEETKEGKRAIKESEEHFDAMLKSTREKLNENNKRRM